MRMYILSDLRGAPLTLFPHSPLITNPDHIHISFDDTLYLQSIQQLDLTKC
jgi:hypothetical protein